jgi:hypothetical protein
MEHFVNIIMEKNDKLVEGLDRSIFSEQVMFETEQGATVIQIPLPRQLSEDESDEYASRLANYMFEMGYSDFDIEISTEGKELDEETYDGNDFFEEYDVMWFNEDDALDEAEYQGRSVPLGKPMQGDVKKFKVYVKKPTGNVVKVNFGDPDMRIKKSNPARRRSFRARHNCDNPGPRTKARYWSCRAW